MQSRRNSNPYNGVNWDTVPQVIGCTHMHCINQQQLAEFLKQGLELVSFSNYYPSAPYYPLSSIRENTFKCRQTGFVKNGRWETGEAVWKKQLSPEEAAKLPAEEGERIFEDLPENVMEIPNAEHHWFSDASIYLHITAPGALLAGSSFDRENKFNLTAHGITPGTQVPWREAFGKLLDSLMIPDGGGVIINHPTWSHLPIDFICEMLDSDPRVLGIEVYNSNSRVCFSDFSDSIWDAILSTGRQCFGFFVQDHPPFPEPWRGKIALLPDERTPESCLRAMRQGRFYGMIAGNGLKFEYLNFNGKTLSARCNREVEFQLISKTGVVGDVSYGREFRYDLPENSEDEHVFLRLTAREGRGEEMLYSQPFMLVNNPGKER